MSETTTKTKSTAKRYVEAIGRRKTATARVRLTPAAKHTFLVNDKDGHDYFPTAELKAIMHGAFENTKVAQHYEVSVHVSGSGIHSQAEAIRHGISRALVEIDAEMRGELKKLGFLKRDPRAKERRKFGLKKARKAPQWSKR
ncbi:MAG TPA: 30S ribosomal protein S9 [Candidatus Paceibacterota bacterium]|nr:30S ribosomal protein S9 [Candidatus Paceibacterota bacterium]